MAEIKTIGVIGGGTMGNGIVHVAAKAGFKVILLDIEQRFRGSRAGSTISKNMDREVAKSKISAELTKSDSDPARYPATTAAADMAEADFIVEAVIENLDLKSKIFADDGYSCATRSDTGFEYVVDFDHQDRFANEAAGPASSGCIS